MDHYTAVGDFQALVALRAKHLRKTKDGETSRKHAKIYRRRRIKFKNTCPGPGVRLAIFGSTGGGAFVTAERASFMVHERLINFPWTDAQRLLHQADAIADQAVEWWPRIEDGKLSRQERKQKEANDLERRPHIDRAYNVMTAILSAIDQESRRVGKDKKRHDEERDVRSEAYRASMIVIEADLARAEALLDAAAQRQAQLSYTKGMLLGAAAVGLVSLAIGVAFYLTDTPAADGVALLAGALGALVSVLQRMTSGSLRLDTHAGTGMLFRFGALRPVIGAILGMAVFTFVVGGLLPVISSTPNEELAFVAAVAFLAGFNERFAQDVIARSGQHLTA
jgi:hypothetical protein